MKIFKLLVLSLFLAIMADASAMAHKINVFAWETGDGSISAEAKFAGGRAARNVEVDVIDGESGKTLLTGETGTDGLFTFPIPETSARELDIVVNAGDGHKNSWRHILSEPAGPQKSLAAATDAAPTDGVKSPVASAAAGSKSSTAVQPAVLPAVQSSPVSPAPQINQQELVALIEKAMDRKLAPLRKSLAESAEAGPTLQDILGGIGYLFGLAGIAAYFQSRKKR